MNELVYLKNNAAVCDSLQVAEKFGKNHKYVLEKIEKLLGADSANKLAQCIRVSKYKDASGKCNKMYLLNKDGFVFLAFGFTGKEADFWKWKYIDAFNQMEKLIREKGTAAYRISEQEERMTRRAETDAIKEFVEYAKEQGSTHADHYYSNCTRLAYKTVGITDKGTAAGSQLDDLSLVEHLIAHTLRTGMAAGRGYKDIYLDCKHRLESMKYLQCTA
jgi:Rha family phage regulatory protein